MQRAFLTLYFIATGWLPLFYGIYLANSGQFIIAAIILFVSFCGFRQVYDNFNYQESIKAKEEKLESQRKRLIDNFNELEKRNKTIERLYRERSDY